MKYLIAFILATCALHAIAQPDNPVIQEFEIEKIFFEGKDLYRQGRFNTAIVQFNEVINRSPLHPKVYEMRAEAFFKLGNYLQAIEDYEVAIRREPLNAELYNSAGVAAAQLGRYALALRYFEDALTINQSHKGATENIALLRERYQGNPAPGGRTGAGLVQIDDDIFSPDRGGAPKEITIVHLKPESIRKSSSKARKRAPKEPVERSFSSSSRRFIYTARMGDVDVGAQSDPNIEIQRVIVREKETEVSFSFKNISDKKYPLQLERNDPSRTFYITDKNLTKKIRLKSIRNLDRLPSSSGYREDLRPRSQTTFVAVFEALPSDMYTFHLLEGTEARPGAFHFWNVTLKD